MSIVIKLNERLDFGTIEPLANDLRSNADQDLLLDAAQVRHFGSLALQLILSAVKTRTAQGKSTQLVNASDACVEQLCCLGFTPESLTSAEFSA